MATGIGAPPIQRLQISVRGAVQGVGFRPFVYRLASDLGLAGWVRNAAQGLSLEVEGNPTALRYFKQRLTDESPPRALIQHVETAWLAPYGYTAFTIQPSTTNGVKSAVVTPDIATCKDCLHELFNPHDRRYSYPFINCTHCGPRFSILEALPYDRPNTTMRHFNLCHDCQTEYGDPQNRRFHAQPNACPQCGPSLALWNRDGVCLSTRHDALQCATDAVRHGAIVAVKGLGGFHLIADARNPAAIRQLRQRKHREQKPFALMMPSLATTERFCHVNPLEAQLLCSPASPIVLLRRKSSQLPDSIAPGNPNFGVMLPYTPLHHLLMRHLGFPIIATSGNRASEPLCTDEYRALDRLARIADAFLVHNRPIAQPMDDSIVRVILDTEQVLRRARGYAPLSIAYPEPADVTDTVLAVGAHLKSTIAVTGNQGTVMSQHIGDLETAEALTAFEQTLDDIPNLHDLRPTAVVCDVHPDYLSTRCAETRGLPLQRIQHHVAHVWSCMADHQLRPPVLGIAWDGSGYGLDGTIWGGEFISITGTDWQRVAHFRPFPLPGGERAVKGPRRVALGMLYTLFGDALFDRNEHVPVLQTFTEQERKIVRTMLDHHLNAPLTSSAGRLFDGVAALIGLQPITTFEGQAAMALEFALDGIDSGDSYPFKIDDQHATAIIDWGPLVCRIHTDDQNHVPMRVIAARFHNTLAEIIVAIAKRKRADQVVLTGGCFQNRYLTERAVKRLRDEGFRPFWHQRVPPNDGGIALGQLAARHHMPTQERVTCA